MLKLYELTKNGLEVTGLTVVKETPKQYQYNSGRKNPERLNKSDCDHITYRWSEYSYYDTQDLPLEEIEKVFDDRLVEDMLTVREVFERNTKKLVDIRKGLTR